MQGRPELKFVLPEWVMNSLGKRSTWETGVGRNYRISGWSIFFSFYVDWKEIRNSRPEVFYETAFPKYFVNFTIITMLQMFSCGFHQGFWNNLFLSASGRCLLTPSTKKRSKEFVGLLLYKFYKTFHECIAV